MRIDKKLNIVLPLEKEDGTQFYVHSTPIGADLFDQYWEPISLVFAKIMKDGHEIASGPRIADKMLRKVGKQLQQEKEIEMLFAEMRRLTNVLVPNGKSWEMYLLDDAKARKILSTEEAAQVEARITFFTAFSHMLSREERAAMLDSAANVSGARIESLECSAFMRSLQTSTVDANSGAKAA